MTAMFKVLVVIFALTLSPLAHAFDYDLAVSAVLSTNEKKSETAKDLFLHRQIPAHRRDLFEKLLLAAAEDQHPHVRENAMLVLYMHDTFGEIQKVLPRNAEQLLRKAYENAPVDEVKSAAVAFLLDSPLKEDASIELVLKFFEERQKEVDVSSTVSLVRFDSAMPHYEAFLERFATDDIKFFVRLLPNHKKRVAELAHFLATKLQILAKAANKCEKDLN